MEGVERATFEDLRRAQGHRIQIIGEAATSVVGRPPIPGSDPFLEVGTMARELRSLDISDTPELLRLAEEVRASGEPRVLRRHNEDIALLMPVPPSRTRRSRRTRTEADRAAFRAAAGTWKDFDLEKFLEDLYESRRSSRPPIEL